jgi:hypothetical protein
MTVIFEAYADEEAFAAHHHGHIEELEARLAHLVDPSSFWLSVLRGPGICSPISATRGDQALTHWTAFYPTGRIEDPAKRAETQA